jgi:HAD superfamily hydrolase (TIGR01509 family)
VDWFTNNASAIQTVFLDAGNTLISMDYDWIARELAACGAAVDSGSLERAEAAARPATSDFVAANAGQPDADAFKFHLRGMLGLAEGSAALATERRHELVDHIAPRIRQPGQDYRLWSRVLPGVPDALAALKALGIDLIVVSNSDGSVERALAELGLTEHLKAVLDSAVVGHEKPDPRIFERALAVAGVAPEAALHVGDMYHQDVRGARAAGIEPVLLDPFSDWPVDDCLRCSDLAAFARRMQDALSHQSGGI